MPKCACDLIPGIIDLCPELPSFTIQCRCYNGEVPVCRTHLSQLLAGQYGVWNIMPYHPEAIPVRASHQEAH